MTIRILPQEEIIQIKQAHHAVRQTPPLRQPQLQKIYAHRIRRFQELMVDNPLADYLNFCLKVTEQQKHLVNIDPLDITTLERPFLLITQEKTRALPMILDRYLPAFLEGLKGITPEVDRIIATIETRDRSALEQNLSDLLSGQFDRVSADETLFLWCVMMPYFTQLAEQLTLESKEEAGEQRYLCPLCGSHPVASVIATGKEEGLRYLHCSLCESEWHVPRVKCSACDNLEGIVYYSLNEDIGAVKAESCPKCESYLNVINLEKSPRQEVIADDLDQWALDQEMLKLHQSKTGFNPFVR